MSWLGSVMHIMHISFPKIRVTDTVLRMFGDHMMAHKRPSLSSSYMTNDVHQRRSAAREWTTSAKTS